MKTLRSALELNKDQRLSNELITLTDITSMTLKVVNSDPSATSLSLQAGNNKSTRSDSSVSKAVINQQIASFEKLDADFELGDDGLSDQSEDLSLIHI